VGGYFLYDAAYGWGEVAGYDEGYPAGHEAGYSEGEEDGYDAGYIVGEEDGYGAGEEDGYEVGYSAGEEDGYDEGYDEGYTSGETDGYASGEAAGEVAGYISGRQVGYDEGYSEGIEDGLGHGYTLKDPTYQEALAFMSQDRTDENEYVLGTYGVYVCSHFSRDVCNNAEAEGLRCAYVELRYSDGGHVIVAFNTVDRGIIYFEPQSDERVEPVIGKRYYQCIIPAPGYYYSAPSYDDTIMDILVIW
jgi:hypothetical protein